MVNHAVSAMSDSDMAIFLGDDMEPMEPTEPNPVSEVGARMNDPEAIKRFILAGKAIFTLVSERTATRYTFKVSKAEPNPQYHNQVPTYFVNVLNGPDNGASYVYAGLLQDMGMGWGIRQTRGSRVSPSADSYKAISWYLSRVLNHRPVEGVEFWHEGKCGRCGRRLTVPESIAAGIGPECATKGM